MLTELILAHHLKISRITRRMSLPGDYIEALILNEIARKETSSTDLHNLLHLPKSLLSRRLESLTAMGFVRSQRSSTDGRSQLLSLSIAGVQRVSTVNLLRSAAASLCVHPLSQPDEQSLIPLVEGLGTGLGAGKRPESPFSSPLLRALEQLSFGLRIIQESILDLGVSADEFQLLHSLVQRPLSQKQLMTAFCLSSAATSRLLSNLELADLLHRSPLSRDRRLKGISLTPKGHDLIVRGRAELSRLIEKGIEPLSESETRRLCSLMQGYVYRSESPQVVRFGEFEIYRARSSRDSAVLRAFTIGQYLTLNRLIEYPELAFPEAALNLGMRRKGTLITALSVATVGKSKALYAAIPTPGLSAPQALRVCGSAGIVAFLDPQELSISPVEWDDVPLEEVEQPSIGLLSPFN